MSFNLATMLRESAAAHPDKPVCLAGSDVLTYGELDEAAGRVAGWLRARGLRPGDTVAVQLPNSPEFLQAYFGIVRAGMVMVPLNPQLRDGEIAHQLRDAQVRLLITAGESRDHALAAAAAAGQVDVEVVSLGAGLAFAPAIGGADGGGDVAATNPDDPAVILYTSGTTGRPKGAELTHFQLFQSATVVGEVFGVREDDVTLAALPFFHVFALSSLVNVAVRYGTTLSLCARFEAELALDTMAEHGVTVVCGVPTMFYALLSAGPGERDLSRFRIASSGGSSIPGEVLRRFEETFGVVILEGYGMTETASTVTVNRSAEDRRILSVGRPIWGVDVRVADTAGRELPPGPDHVGQVAVRGFNVMKGYRGNPEATAEVLRDGWLQTGDLGWVDTNGYLYIVDRLKDLIIRGGYNVYPREVEEVLYAHPAIAEAAVVGRPDPRLGEEVVAVVSLRRGVDATADEISTEIITHCRERLAAYKCPREVRILPELPKNSSGKLSKKELR